MSLYNSELFKPFNTMSTVLYDVVRGYYLYMDATIPFLVKVWVMVMFSFSSENNSFLFTIKAKYIKTSTKAHEIFLVNPIIHGVGHNSSDQIQPAIWSWWGQIWAQHASNNIFDTN